MKFSTQYVPYYVASTTTSSLSSRLCTLERETGVGERESEAREREWGGGKIARALERERGGESERATARETGNVPSTLNQQVALPSADLSHLQFQVLNPEPRTPNLKS